MPRRRRPYRTAANRILDVLGVGGERKLHILAAMIGDRRRTLGALKRLKAAGLVRVRMRQGGPHYDLTAPQKDLTEEKTMNAPLPRTAASKIDYLLVGTIVPSETDLQKLRRQRILAAPAALEELAASLKADGMHLPLIVRPLVGAGGDALRRAGKEHYELVAGERRWRAAQIAGLTEVPAIIRELDDRQALRAQIAENLQRETLSALEEAEGYRALMAQEDTSVEGLMPIVGKSRSWIYDRLKLLDLSQEGREAVITGALDPYLALIVARVKGEKLQKKALKIALQPGQTVRMLKHHLTGKGFTESLGTAPFPITVTTLHPERGACTDCPERSGNGSEFDAAEDDPDVCTDPACYQVKSSRHADQLIAAAREAGRPILTGPAAKEVSPRADVFIGYLNLAEIDADDDYPEAPPKDMDSPEYATWQERADAWKPRTWRGILEATLEAGEALEPVLLEDPREARLHELIPVERARRLLKRKGIALPTWIGAAPTASTHYTPPTAEERAEQQRKQEAERERDEQEKKFRVELFNVIHAKCKGPFNRDDWAAIAEHALNYDVGDDLGDALFGGKLDLSKMKDHELQRLVRLAPVTQALHARANPAELFALAKRYKVDPQKVKAAMRDEAKPAKAKAAPKKKGKKK